MSNQPLVNISAGGFSLGALIAILVLVVVVVLTVIGQMDGRMALLIGGLAIARLT